MRWPWAKYDERYVPSPEYHPLAHVTLYRLAEERVLRRWVAAGVVLSDTVLTIGLLWLLEADKLSGSEAAGLLAVANAALLIVVRHLFPRR